jgi:uncharacterized protein YkwD
MTRLLSLLPALVLVVAGPVARAQDKKEAAFQMTPEEKKLLELTNAARAKEKLPPLAPNPLLFKAARLHSANMAKKGEMNHVLDGKTPVHRAQAVGYAYRRLAENIAWNDGLPLKTIMDGWMKSKHHRENILQPAFEEIGLGIARSDKGEIYYTQVFGTPKKK